MGNHLGLAISTRGQSRVLSPDARHAQGVADSEKSLLFTLGYQQRSIKEFLGLLRRAEVDVVIDVRETAWSHKPGFSKTALQARLGREGIEYVHARFAGNPKQIRTKATSHSRCLALYAAYLKKNRGILRELDDLIGIHLATGKRVCLMCYERHPADCHRGILSSKWRAGRPRRVMHLATEGCPRLVTEPL